MARCQKPLRCPWHCLLLFRRVINYYLQLDSLWTDNDNTVAKFHKFSILINSVPSDTTSWLWIDNGMDPASDVANAECHSIQKLLASQGTAIFTARKITIGEQ